MAVAVQGRYRLEEEIGRGAFGQVFRATRLLDGQPVALKLMHKGVCNEHHRRRYEREAGLLVKVSHPNVVRMIDFGVAEDDRPFIVLELVVGVTLKALLRREGELTLRRAGFIVAQVLSGLAAAHSVGVVHRDIKPSNIIVCAGTNDHVKLLDFGVAKPLPRAGDWTTLTESGQMVGTPHYMAPEQVRGDKIDEGVDIYAIGLLFAELLTGARLADGTSDITVFLAHISTRPFELDERVSRSVFGPIIERAVSKLRQARYLSAADMLTAIDGALHAPRLVGATLPMTGTERIPTLLPSRPAPNDKTQLLPTLDMPRRPAQPPPAVRRTDPIRPASTATPPPGISNTVTCLAAIAGTLLLFLLLGALLIVAAKTLIG